VGYFWSLKGLPYNGEFVSKFVMNIAAPCLILATMVKATISSAALWQMTAITISGLAFFALIQVSLIKALNANVRSYFNPLVFANTGNMGVPICLFAFGEQALALSLVVFMVTSLFHFSVGVSMVGGAHPVTTLLKAPVFYAAIASFSLLLTNTHLPVSLFNSIALIGDSAIPLMLLSLGVSLHSIKLNSIAKPIVFAVLRLAVGFAVGLLLCYLFKLEGMMRGIVLIQSTMPAAVFNYLLASSYKREPEQVAAVVVLSTLLSFITLPFLLWYVL
jgi:predicted permease